MWTDHGVEFFVHPPMQAAAGVGFAQSRIGAPAGWQMPVIPHSFARTCRIAPPKSGVPAS